MSSCSLFRKTCPIDNCHILKQHTHPYIFEKEKFKGKKKKNESDSLEVALDSNGVEVIDSTALESSVNEEVEQEEEESDDVLSMEDEDAKKKKKKKSEEQAKKDAADWEGSWEEKLWNEGADALEGIEGDELNGSIDEEELSGDEEVLDEEGQTEKDLKKEIKEAEKEQKRQEKSSKKEAKNAEKLEKQLNKKWRSNVTPWFRWNQSPKIGEKWQRPEKSK